MRWFIWELVTEDSCSVWTPRRVCDEISLAEPLRNALRTVLSNHKPYNVEWRSIFGAGYVRSRYITCSFDIETYLLKLISNTDINKDAVLIVKVQEILQRSSVLAKVILDNPITLQRITKEFKMTSNQSKFLEDLLDLVQRYTNTDDEFLIDWIHGNMGKELKYDLEQVKKFISLNPTKLNTLLVMLRYECTSIQ